jgi:hypothetical protein
LHFDVEFNDDVSEERVIDIVRDWDYDGDGRLYEDSGMIYFQKKFNVDASKYVLTDCEDHEGKPADIIVYPDVIEKLLRKGRPVVRRIREIEYRQAVLYILTVPSFCCPRNIMSRPILLCPYYVPTVPTVPKLSQGCPKAVP